MRKKAEYPSHLQERAPKEVDEQVLYRIVERTFTGMSVTDIANELNLDRKSITRYKKHDNFSKLMADYLRYSISCRMGEISDALFKEIKKGSVPAITLALKSVGVVDSKAPADQGKDTSITVVMPGAYVDKPAIEIHVQEEVPSEEAQEEDLGSSVSSVPIETL